MQAEYADFFLVVSPFWLEKPLIGFCLCPSRDSFSSQGSELKTIGKYAENKINPNCLFLETWPQT